MLIQSWRDSTGHDLQVRVLPELFIWELLAVVEGESDKEVATSCRKALTRHKKATEYLTPDKGHSHPYIAVERPAVIRHGYIIGETNEEEGIHQAENNKEESTGKEICPLKSVRAAAFCLPLYSWTILMRLWF